MKKKEPKVTAMMKNLQDKSDVKNVEEVCK
jgi:hypothetical protein